MANRRLFTAGDAPALDAGWRNDDDGSATLYLSDDPALGAASLTLVNRTGETVTIPAGVPAAYGATAPGAGALHLYFNGLLDLGEVQAVSVAAEGWSSLPFADDVTGLGYLALAPASAVTLADGETLALPLRGLSAHGSARAGNLTLAIVGASGVPEGEATQSIFVQLVRPPQEGNRALQLLVTFAGPDYVLNDGREQQLLLVLTNPSAEPLVPGGRAAWIDGEPPVFRLGFVFGNSAGALMPGRGNLDVNVQSGYGNAWSVAYDEVSGGPPGWTLTPDPGGNGMVLGTGANASTSFRISGIETTLPAGVTYLYLSYENLPGYDDGYFALEIVKVPPVTARISVSPDQATRYGRPATTTVAVQVANATHATVTNTSFSAALASRRLETDFPVTVDTTTVFTLVATNAYTGETASASATFTVSPDPQSVLPKGAIVMWAGTSVPDGWLLCDGTNGTPNLTNRFILGAGTSPVVHDRGGNETHTHGVNASVTVYSGGKHNHGFPSEWYNNKVQSGDRTHIIDRHGTDVSQMRTTTAGSHSHEASASVALDGAMHMPPWYALAFIQKNY